MKLAIFDLGNVLFQIDFREALVFLTRKTEISPRILLQRIATGAEFEAFERGELSEARFFHWLAGQLDANIATEALIHGWNTIFGPVIRPTCESIRKLSAHMPVVALTNTNTTHQRVWQILYEKELGIFRKIYVSSELGMRKPEKRIYRHVIEEWGVSPEETIFFDDRNENIKTAAEIGIATALVDSDAVVAKWVETFLF